MVAVLFSNMRDSRLWFAPAKAKECRVGIQVLPSVPITEVLFSDVGFVKELLNWTLPALKREEVKDQWKVFVYALEGIYDKEMALKKIRELKDYGDYNSLTNMLWWTHSRDNEEEDNQGRGGGGDESENICWFCQYCCTFLLAIIGSDKSNTGF
ncbi:hypothetical protein JCGZ_25656 [Jatropha curcas]|uniref:glucan endo-1,3-beta-D-glucosidase n=1 Tax=Jatropha curcas TaxID=180498 RepID=A0A067JWH6_JATCU|nr:hypothetical protein JCGZ_25656 [Jatropha curcas]